MNWIFIQTSYSLIKFRICSLNHSNTKPNIKIWWINTSTNRLYSSLNTRKYKEKITYLRNIIFIKIILLFLSVAFCNKVCIRYTHEQCFIWCLTVCFALSNFQMDNVMQQLTAQNHSLLLNLANNLHLGVSLRNY